MARSETIERVRTGMLAMQRHSWEQGVAAQSLLELGDVETAVALAKAAAARQLADGRLAMIGNGSEATDPGANGEAVLRAAELCRDPDLEAAAQRMIDWLLRGAPRSQDGILYHLEDKRQLWADSFYMAPPLLAVAGHYEEALRQIEGLQARLFDPVEALYSHIWDDGLNGFAAKEPWGVGNGWALAGMTRVIRRLPDRMAQGRARLIAFVREAVEGCLARLRGDGLFHNVVNDPTTFVETNLAQMLSYTLYRGMSGGWLDSSYETAAARMRAAATAKVDRFGLVQGVCAAPSFDRPGTAAEGQAFFLLMEASAVEFYGA